MATRYWVDKAQDLITIECYDNVDMCEFATQILRMNGDPDCVGVSKRLVDVRNAKIDGPVSAFRALVRLFACSIRELQTGRVVILVNKRAGLDWAHSLFGLVEPRKSDIVMCHTGTDACELLNIQDL